MRLHGIYSRAGALRHLPVIREANEQMKGIGGYVIGLKNADACVVIRIPSGFWLPPE